MKYLSLAGLALFLACGVQAESQGPGHCSGDLDDASQAQSVTEVVVWVNENGDRLGTETNHHAAAATPAPQGISPSTVDTLASIPAPEPGATRTFLTQAKPRDETVKTDEPALLDKKHKHDLEAHPHPHPNPHPRPDHDQNSHRQFGISYSPYNADRSCKTPEQVNKDLDQLSDYSFVRIYGTDCDQTQAVASAARQHNMQVFAGIYDLTGFPDSLSSFTDAATLPNGKQDWSVFHTIAIGNELVNGGHNSPADVTSAVYQARSILRGHGYEGFVVTVDTFSVLLQHPELCKASDYCAANCHAFFDATQQPHNAGPYVLEQAHSVSAAAGGKRTIITESGWPHAGQANGAAVPSPENQRIAVDSIRRSFAHRGDDVVLFTAHDDLWKEDNPYTFNAERFWGIYPR
ncbi:Glycoside hydrolase superfamily [Penicillium hispanicum]|uniref:Glycoside hydrolase superfamily n=1 Tax=Penicillium hispanicum TaxID=1080232 RepID=UPI0025425225|nr:Glycoside hydrolase superfamily [Penicillium hispanicum]KAJ5570537.1 Glycoside hydrolase superfamily [Penicillium hispanicum]